MRRLLLVLPLLLGAVAPSARAQTIVEDAVRLRLDPTVDSLSQFADFGFSTALRRDLALVGAPGDTVGPPRSPPNSPDNRRGSTFVFERTAGDWAHVARLVARDGREGDRFGWSVSLSDGPSGTLALVGAPSYFNGPTGRAYIFRRHPASGQWDRGRLLLPASAQPNEQIGRGVALVETRFGSVAVVGAPGYVDPATGQFTGRAYTFERDPPTGEWAEAAALNGCIAAPPGSGLGDTVAATATPDVVVAALAGVAPVGEEPSSSAGCLYTRDDRGTAPGDWVLRDTLAADPPGDNGTLSTSLAAASGPDGRSVVVLGLSYQRRALVYEHDPTADTWMLAATLVGPATSFYGRSVGLTHTGEGYTLAVGASFDGQFGPNAGAGYVYHRADGPAGTPWSPVAILGPPEPFDFGYLGNAAAVGPDGQIFLGSPSSRQDGEGRMFVYDVANLLPVAADASPETSGGLSLSLAPNPSSGPVAVGYALRAPGAVRLSVVDALGREVAVVAEGERAAGAHAARIDARRLPAGVYAVRLVAGDRRETVRLVVAR